MALRAAPVADLLGRVASLAADLLLTGLRVVAEDVHAAAGDVEVGRVLHQVVVTLRVVGVRVLVVDERTVLSRLLLLDLSLL